MSTVFDPLASERLVLRRFRSADLEAFLAYRSDPERARYQGWSSPSPEEARRFVEAQAALVPGTPGVGAQIAVEERASGTLLGDLYLDSPADPEAAAEIGFTLARPHEGRGFATEAVETLLAYVFGPLARPRVTATTLTANIRSVALLERIGMRREAHHRESARDEGAWADECVYALLRSEWHARNRA